MIQETHIASTKVIDEQNHLAWSINRKEPLKAIAIAEKTLQQSREENYQKGIGEAFKVLGSSNIWISKNEEALEYSYQAIEIFQKTGDSKNLAESYYCIGTNFYYLSNYESALKYYNECYTTCENSGDEEGMADGLNGLGTVNYTIEKNEIALNFLLKGKALAEKNKAHAVLMKILDGLGETYFNLKRYDEALEYNNLCIKAVHEFNGTEQLESFSLDGKGKSYAAKKDFDNALVNFNQSLEIRKKIKFQVGVSTTLTNIGSLYLTTGQASLAIPYLEEAYVLAKEIQSPEGIYKSTEQLSLAYEALSKFDLAITYFKIFHEVKEDVRNETTSQLVKSQEMQQKMLQNETEKNILSEKNKELEKIFKDIVLVGDIGQQIISNLSVETIVDTVYESVNGLMDATGFGIGLYMEATQEILYPIYIEGEDKIENIHYPLADNDRLTVKCFQSNAPIVINDMEKEIEKFLTNKRAPVAGKEVCSLIYLPLQIKDKAVGVITVQSFQYNAYTDYHISILKNIATYTAIALENARLYEKQEEIVEERTREVVKKKEEVEKAYESNRLLSEIGQQITSTLNFDEIFTKLYHCVNQLMDAGCFGVRIYHAEKNIVEYKFEIEKGVKDTQAFEVSMDDHDNYSVWCIVNKKEIFINDNLTEHTKYVSKIRVVWGEMPHSLIFYPIQIADRVLGVITIQSFERNAYTPQHLDILKTLASYTAIALENANLYETLEEKVKARTAEVEKQKAIIEVKNKDITDSIRYAKKIQQAIMPKQEEIQLILPDSFIFYRPKDIVSGDFYWFENFANRIQVFAVADCTGHGVPGAFMSAICNDLMNQVIRDGEISTPGKALEVLDQKLRLLLNKSVDHSSNDGMDIALCAFYPQTRELHYAGAHRPLTIIRNGEILETKPTKHSIGGYFVQDKKFVDHVIQLQTGDAIYIFTDGYSDQFGGEKGKKFKYKNLLKLLLEIHNLPMKEQKTVLEKNLISWQGYHEQLDDNLIMGVRI